MADVHKSSKRSKLLAWLSYLEIKTAAKTGIAASLSLVLGIAFTKIVQRPDALISGLWSVLASIVVMQSHIEGTYKAAFINFLGIAIGSIAGAIFLDFLGSDVLGLGLSVFFTILICALLNIKESFRIASLSTAVIIVLAGLNPSVNPWIYSIFRFLDSCIGLIVAIFVAHIFWPEKAIENLRINVLKTLTLLSKYYRLSTLLDKESESHIQTTEIVSNEIEDLLYENRLFRDDAKIEFLEKEAQRDQWILLSHQLEIVYENITALKNVQKEGLDKIFDDNLAAHVNEMIDKTDLGFQSLKSQISDEKAPISSQNIDHMIDALNQDLIRFRATRTTRKFSLSEVESFFVFFYNLRSIAESIKKMEFYIHHLHTPTIIN